MGDAGSRTRAFFSYVTKIVSAKKHAKRSTFTVDRDVTAGEVAAGIAQESSERIPVTENTSIAGHFRCGAVWLTREANRAGDSPRLRSRQALTTPDFDSLGRVLESRACLHSCS